MREDWGEKFSLAGKRGVGSVRILAFPDGRGRATVAQPISNGPKFPFALGESAQIRLCRERGAHTEMQAL